MNLCSSPDIIPNDTAASILHSFHSPSQEVVPAPYQAFWELMPDSLSAASLSHVSGR